jgi:GNAT superfamily N-acetyltransferase
MDRAWTARAAGPDDYEDQRRLFNLCFGKTKGVDTFRWKYAENPHGPAVSQVACDAEGRVVGGYSYVPRRFRRDGEKIVLMQASDAMVDPSARRQGIFTELDDVVCELAGKQGISWAYAYSGRISFNGFLGNGWECIGHAPVYRYRFASRRGLARAGRMAPLAVLAAPLLDGVYRLRDRRLARHRSARLALEPLSRFDATATELFEACVPARGLMGERDAAWLNWRYVDNPSQRQECFALRSTDGSELLGWLVAEFSGGNAFLVDHLARDDRARDALLAGFTCLAHERGMAEATAMLFAHHPSVPVLLGYGWKAPRQDKPFRDMFPWIVRACRDDSAAEDTEMVRWLLADGDRDAEHMSP